MMVRQVIYHKKVYYGDSPMKINNISGDLHNGSSDDDKVCMKPT